MNSILVATELMAMTKRVSLGVFMSLYKFLDLFWRIKRKLHADFFKMSIGR